MKYLMAFMFLSFISVSANLYSFSCESASHGIMRCENREAVCYTTGSGISCKFK